MWMLIYKVPECTIIESQPDDEFHPVDSIPDKRPADQQKTSLSIGLYFLYEITLEETDCVSKDTSVSIGNDQTGRHRHSFDQIVIILWGVCVRCTHAAAFSWA